MDRKTSIKIEIDGREKMTINEAYRYLLNNDIIDQEIFDIVIEKIDDVNILIDGVSLLQKFLRYNNFYLKDRIDVKNLIKKTNEKNLNIRKNGINNILECHYVIRGIKKLSKNLRYLLEDERVDLRRYNEDRINYGNTDSTHYSMLYILIKNKDENYTKKYFDRLIEQEIDYNREFYDIIEEIMYKREYKYIEEEIKDKVNKMGIKREESIIDIPIYIEEIIIQNYMDIEKNICNIPSWIRRIRLDKNIYYREEENERIRKILEDYNMELLYI